MFPDRVGRVVLDGVVDADHYVSPVWKGSLRDTDDVYNSFSKYCHQAEGKCALWRLNDTISNIEDRLESVFTNLKENPLSIIDPKSKIPVIVGHTEMRALTFLTLYAPTQAFIAIAMIVDQLYRGLDTVLSQIFIWPPAYELPSFCGPPPSPQYYNNEAQRAIMCSDKRYTVSFPHLIISCLRNSLRPRQAQRNSPKSRKTL
jgi:hypothetical protein